VLWGVVMVVLSMGARRVVKARRLDGESLALLAGEFGVSAMTVWRIANDDRVRVFESCRSSGQLSAEQREQISLAVAGGVSQAEIARRVGCHRSTISRELKRNGGREVYRAVAAERRAVQCARRPKLSKFEANPRLGATVSAWLAKSWSPQQISARLRVEFPDDESMRVSHETTYQAIYVYGRGGLKAELAKHLRTKRPQRRSRSETTRNSGSKIVDMVSIRDRPDEVEDRLIPGHWEGDLIIGKNQASQIGTLVERTTGFALLVALPDNRRADTVAAALARQTATLPAQTLRSVTWDQGVEMADHKSFTLATDIAVYFCDPHAPWQRGTNENFNGLLRQYFPKGTDLSVHSQQHLDHVARELNERPRARHQFLTPSEVFETKFGAPTT